MKISKDKKLPDSWINFQSEDHRYIGIPFGVTRKCEYEVYLCDDSTLNQMQYLFTAKGNKLKVAHQINQHEAMKNQAAKDLETINKMIG